MRLSIGIFAHQEERRIAACLASLPLDEADYSFHILVNGSTDATVERATEAANHRPNVIVHDLHPGGKSRTWNRFIHDIAGEADAYILMDGDAEIAHGSLPALAEALAADPRANAAAGMPLNGRSAEEYRQALHVDRGLFGDLYALSADFVGRLRTGGIRLPDDLIGDDGLVSAMAMTDIGPDAQWDKSRVVPCDKAGFLCEPVSLGAAHTWRMQYKRMTNYSVRYMQNRIVSDIMTRSGPEGLPGMLSDLYAEWLPRLKPRLDPRFWWFDILALKKMRAAVP